MLHRAQPLAFVKEVAFSVSFNALVFHLGLQAPDRRLPERLAGGRKIVLANGRIVLTLFAWLALSLARMRVRSGGLTYVLLEDVIPLTLDP